MDSLGPISRNITIKKPEELTLLRRRRNSHNVKAGPSIGAGLDPLGRAALAVTPRCPIQAGLTYRGATAKKSKRNNDRGQGSFRSKEKETPKRGEPALQAGTPEPEKAKMEKAKETQTK